MERVQLFVDPNDSRGLVSQLYAQLRDAIADGRLAPGDRLTATRTLATELGVSRFTVTEVYARLTAEGLVEGRAGGGSIVRATSALDCSPIRPAALAPRGRASRIQRFDRDPLVQATFDMRPGAVDMSLFPVQMWRRCMVRALRQPATHYSDPAGTWELRTALARWINRSRGIVTAPEDVIVTSGAQHAIDLIARVLIDPGDTAAVEEPGYPPVVALLRAQGANVVGIPVDRDGIVVDAIPSSARLVYVTPSHQYPLGVTLAHSRRLELLHWASVNNAAVVEDDYDTEFRHSPRPLEPLQRLDRDGRVVYVGTYSKSLAPSLRLGFAAVPRTIAPAMQALRQTIDWCPPVTTQEAFTTFVDDGHLDRHLRRARRTYRERHRILRPLLEEALADRGRVLPSNAGLHLAVLLKDGVADSDSELREKIAAHDLFVGSLRRTYHFTEPPSGLVVGFGALPTDQVRPAVKALAAALQ